MELSKTGPTVALSYPNPGSPIPDQRKTFVFISFTTRKNVKMNDKKSSSRVLRNFCLLVNKWYLKTSAFNIYMKSGSWHLTINIELVPTL